MQARGYTRRRLNLKPRPRDHEGIAKDVQRQSQQECCKRIVTPTQSVLGRESGEDKPHQHAASQ